MTRYIKNKDGKFAGSIGQGKTRTPASPPHIPSVASDTALPTYAHDPDDLCAYVATEFDAMPDFTSANPDIASVLFPLPPVEERQEWTQLAAQENVDKASDVVMKTLRELNTYAEYQIQHGTDDPALSKDRQSQISMALWCADAYGGRAQELWEDGRVYRASAYFVLASAANQAAEMTERNIDLLHEDNPSEKPSKINLSAVESAFRYACTGAVLMDYLKHCNGDPAAAATMAWLIQETQGEAAV